MAMNKSRRTDDKQNYSDIVNDDDSVPPSTRSTLVSSSNSIELADFELDLEEGGFNNTNNNTGVPIGSDIDGYADDEEGYSNIGRPRTFQQRLLYFLVRLLNGPKNLKKDTSFTLFSKINWFKIGQLEKYPVYFHDRYSGNKRFMMLLVYYLVWSLLIYSSLHDTLTKEPSYTHLSEAPESIISLSCRQSSLFWQGKNSKCGLKGDNCRPFEDREVTFRCPALCDMDSITYSEIPVGDEVIKYKAFYIGGGGDLEKDEYVTLDNGEKVKYLSKPYRADSFPCGAAVHAGVISPLYGGCARVKFSGEQTSFASSKGMMFSNSMDSIEFDSFFPSSFRFIEKSSKNEKCFNCYDTRFRLFSVNYIMGLIVMYLDIHSLVSFITLSIVGFWSIVLSFDPPIIIDVLNKDSLPSLISLGFERFLPCIFIIYTLWKLIISHSLKFPNSPLSKLLFWYNCFWFGILNNVTFDRLPVDRLTLKDIKTQPGSMLATVFIVVFILGCSIIQGFKLWESGKFKKNLVIYLCIITILVILGNLPHLNLRIHHYILALVLIVGTKTKGLTAMIFQGLLYGLLINGIARWGFASILETRTSLLRGDPRGDVKPPEFTGFDSGKWELSWSNSSSQLDYLNGDLITPMNELKGYSLLINDVEMYNGLNTTISLSKLIDANEELNYLKNYLNGEMEMEMEMERNETDEATIKDLRVYFRVGRSEADDTKGHGKRSDYTRAGVLTIGSNGDITFHNPPGGLT